MESALILASVAVYLAAAFGWQSIRVWRRHRVWPIVFAREAAPAQRLFAWLTLGLLFVTLGASVGRVAFGPDTLGIWNAVMGLKTIGWLLFVAGALLTVTAQRQMGASWRVGIDDRPTRLVTGGVFQYVRNPIFTGLLLSLGGYACLMPAWWSLGLWAATAAGIRLQITWEEQHLVALHGATYVAYAGRVGRLVPLVGRLRRLAALPSGIHGRS